MLGREMAYRRDKKLSALLRHAKLRQQALVEDVDYRAARGLDRRLSQKLVAGDWIDAYENLVINRPVGVCKSWLACALGHKACRDNRPVLYQRVPKLFGELTLARGDGRYNRISYTLGNVQLLILDDWGLEALNAHARHNLLKISRNDTGGAPPSSPAKRRWPIGMLSLVTPPMLTRFWITSSASPTASTSRASACAK